MTLPEKIVKHRKENGWSQEELAERLYVSRQAVSRWENGSALPEAENILQISKLFNVTADYLLNDDYASDGEIPPVKSAENKTEPAFFKNKRLHLVAAIAFTVSALSACIALSTCKNDAAAVANGIWLSLSIVSAAIQFALYFKKD